MNDEISERNELIKETIEIFRNSISEKTIFEYFLQIHDENKTATPIGYVKDITSRFKNEFFKEIYQDENGVIIDLRLYFKRPSESEIENMKEYWIALQNVFKKPVAPYFVVSE